MSENFWGLFDNLEGKEREEIESITEQNLKVLESTEIKFNTITQGVHKGGWYFGKLFKNSEKFTEGIVWEKQILLNKKNVVKVGNKFHEIEDNQIKKFGLNYKHALEPLKNFWSNDESDYSINKYLKEKNKKILDTDYFYNQIKNKIKYYMDVQDERVFDVATCWVIGTYMYELFETYGYLYFRALRDSGKSKFKKILRLIGFCGQDASSITEASFFRSIENTKGVLCLDEYEKMTTDRKIATDLLLNAGIEQGATVKRYDIDLKMNLDFDVYCPKIICNITGLDPTTMSRCIVVDLIRTSSEKGKRKPRERDYDWQHLRDMCYVFAMENWREINRIYETYDYSKTNNRNEDLWRPILSIAKFFGNGVEESLKGYCAKITEEIKEEEIEDSLPYLILSQLAEMFSFNPEPRFLTTKEISDWIVRNTGISFGDKKAEKVIGWQLKNLKSYFKHSRSSKERGWVIGLKDVHLAMISRDFPIPEWKKGDISDISDASTGIGGGFSENDENDEKND